MAAPDQIQCPDEPSQEKLIVRIDKVIPSDLRLLDDSVAEIVTLIKRVACWDDVENIDLALHEALANAMIHGNGCDSSKAVRVSVALEENRGLLVVVKDEGSGFEPSQLANPLVGQNRLASHGRGIFLISHLTDNLHFKFDEGTAVYMRWRTSAKRRI